MDVLLQAQVERLADLRRQQERRIRSMFSLWVVSSQTLDISVNSSSDCVKYPSFDFEENYRLLPVRCLFKNMH